MNLAEIKERWNEALNRGSGKSPRMTTPEMDAVSARLDKLIRQLEEEQKNRVAIHAPHAVGPLTTAAGQRADFTVLMRTFNHTVRFQAGRIEIIGMNHACFHQYAYNHSVVERAVDYAEILDRFLRLRCAG